MIIKCGKSAVQKKNTTCKSDKTTFKKILDRILGSILPFFFSNKPNGDLWQNMNDGRADGWKNEWMDD